MLIRLRQLIYWRVMKTNTRKKYTTSKKKSKNPLRRSKAFKHVALKLSRKSAADRKTLHQGIRTTSTEIYMSHSAQLCRHRAFLLVGKGMSSQLASLKARRVSRHLTLKNSNAVHRRRRPIQIWRVWFSALRTATLWITRSSKAWVSIQITLDEIAKRDYPSLAPVNSLPNKEAIQVLAANNSNK